MKNQVDQAMQDEHALLLAVEEAAGKVLEWYSTTNFQPSANSQITIAAGRKLTRALLADSLTALATLRAQQPKN